MGKIMRVRKPTFLYYDSGQTRTYYDASTGEMDDDELFPKRDHSYFVRPGYGTTKDELARFTADFIEWTESLSMSLVEPINYTYYKSDYGALKLVFKSQCDPKIYQQLTTTSIEIDEVVWIGKCNNGYHSYINDDYLMKPVKGYGYDYSGFYPWLLSLKKMKIPKGPGKAVVLSELGSKELGSKASTPGFYRAEITYTNKNLCKLFQFSEDNVYTHTSIDFLKYLHINMPLLFKANDVSINLVDDGQPNAYLYNDCYTGEEVFGNWYETMVGLKKEQKKNKLVSWLTKALWGFLSKFNHEFLSDDELEDYDMDNFKYFSNGLTFDVHGNKTWKVVNQENPGTRFALLKPFLNALGRSIVANAMYKLDPTLKNILRVYCDNIVLTKDVKIKNCKYLKLLEPEAKTTGLLYFLSRSRYYNASQQHWAGQFDDKTKKKTLQRCH